MNEFLVVPIIVVAAVTVALLLAVVVVMGLRMYRAGQLIRDHRYNAALHALGAL